MGLIETLAALPGVCFAHPVPDAPKTANKLNPYVPLPAPSTLFTTATFLPSLPSVPKGSVVHVLGADDLSLSLAKDNLTILSRNAQETYDHAVLALKIAKNGYTVAHLIGRSGLIGDFDLLQDAETWLTDSTNGVNGQPQAPNGHSNTSDQALEAAESAFEGAALSLLKQTRRAQRPFVHHAGSSSRLVMNFLPQRLPSSADPILDINLAQPLPRDKLRHAVKGSSEVVVVEASAGKFGMAWAAVVDALEGLECQIRSVLVGEEPDLKQALSSHDVIVHTGSSRMPQSIPSSSIIVPTAESTYTNLLSSSPSPLDVLNSPSSLSASESSSPLYAFGKAVAIRRDRGRLTELVKEVLSASSTRQDVHEALGKWLLVREEPSSEEAGKKAQASLGQGESSAEKEVIELGKQGLWTKRSLWIVISNSWAQDLASSGLHHALASGLDINLLVYETAPSSFSPFAQPQSARDRKKDLALYALNMGDVYVSSVAVYADYAGVINAMREAETYSGPGLVLAYLPWGEKEDGEPIGHGELSGPLERLKETKRAVSGGWWPMFRWDPAAEDGKQFTLDSPTIRSALSQFLDRQSHLSQLTRSTPAIDPSITSSVGTDLVSKRKDKARMAYDALINSLDGPGLLVLYASDAGNAEKVAKRLVSRAKMRGVGAVLGLFDSVSSSLVESIGKESNIVFITSTAGQGEAPQNGREFTKALAKLSLNDVGEEWKDVKITVFGMGDSNYWPRKEDYVYYNKPGKDLFPKLLSLGASELAPLGLGDDQDPDGWQTGYKPWETELWRALGVDSVEVTEAQEETVANEHIKIASEYLRGTILEGLEDKTTGAIGASDAQLTKFHGTYLQDDRDVRESLKAQGLEPAYAFMIRCRMPGGVCTPEQWLAMDRIADEHGNSTFKLTTRQTFQFHGVVKAHLKLAMQAINKSLLDTIAACGDVNRNIQCTVNPDQSHIHSTIWNFAKDMSEYLLPRTSAYHEIWLDKKQVAGGEIGDMEPLYGPTYLPRKFKMAVAVPPDNGVDVFTNDVGFIAIVENDQVVGYNVTVGGGMGVTHSNKKTYPRLGDVIGFVRPEDGIKAAESIMIVQRDNGNRSDRKNARLKYTIDRMTLPVFKKDVEAVFGKSFEPARPYVFTTNIDNFGWVQGQDGNWHFTMFIENGRVEDSARNQFKSGLREIAKVHKGQFRLTANQHVTLANVSSGDKPEIERLLAKWGLDNLDYSALRLSSSACVAFPTCGLAMAESERYLPHLVDKVEKICEEEGLRSDSIVMRMTGCPNGCARPWNAEIAFVGKAPGSYMMMLGGGHHGERLSKPWKSSVTEPEILALLKPLIKRWAIERHDGEHFGDWVIRAGIIKATTHGTNFWEGTDAS